eukprot:GEMP01038926.1.p1 GENE.GEMP01038926.1~~GEMP01038926.1.p1  ORF type:complete len:241 (+),score=63.22 GEMP01038926.1:104-826(+)
MMIRQLRRLCNNTYHVTLSDASELASLKAVLNADSRLLSSPFVTEAGITATEGSRLDTPLTTDEEPSFPFEVAFVSPIGVHTETLHALKNTVAERQSELLYAMANFQNLQRVQKAERDAKQNRSVKRFAESLLPFMDKLGNEAADTRLPYDHAFVEGIRLTYRNAIKSLGKFDARQFAPQTGDVFVTHKHEEVARRVAQSADDANTIASMKTHGWMLQDDVLRKAEVVVYRKEAPTSAET